MDINVCEKLGNDANDTCAMLSENYGGETTKKSNVSEWHKQYKEGRENVEDDESSGRPRSHRTDENVGEVWSLLHSDRRASINQAYPFFLVFPWLHSPA
jgi:hypothetical protein